MRKIIFVFLFNSLFVSAENMTLAVNMRALPDDFKRYFYESEVHVQVYINDNQIFNATVFLKESGDIHLVKIIDEKKNVDPQAITLWAEVLRNGVKTGKCARNCPSGLMEVEYRLDNSVLKLYTAGYETEQVDSNYISLPQDVPGGLIMFNDASITQTGESLSWGINSSLISSIAGWNNRASFQSSGTDGYYNYSYSSLYELFSQKEYQGNFIRLGLFTPDNDTGNVQMSGYGYDTIVGLMWGTSDALLINTDSVSAWPIYVTGRNQSVAEVWREGRLLFSQQLQAGLQALDTRQLPSGIYDISIKIIENGQIVDTQQAQIYKPQGWSNPDKRWRMNFWGGEQRTLAIGDARSYEDNHVFAAGGGVDILMHPRATLGMSTAMTEKDQQVRARTNLMLSPDDTLFAQITMGDTEFHSSQDIDIRYYRNISGGGSASLFWRSTTTDIYGKRTSSRHSGETWGTTLSLRLPRSTTLIANGQYIDTEWRRGFGADVSLTTLTSLGGRDMNFRVSAYDRPGFNHHSRNHGVSFGVNISLTPAARHLISAETGLNQNQSYSSLSYQWQPGDDNYIRNMGGGISYSHKNAVFSGSTAIDTPFISGDGYLQYNKKNNNNTAGGNLSQVLVIGGGKVASVNGNTSRSVESALIVDVETEDIDTKITASGSMSEVILKPGRNVIPTELWKMNTVQFTAKSGDSVQVIPERKNVQIGRGGVQYTRVSVIKTYTLVGMLQDEKGDLLRNRFVSSDVSGGVINPEGVLTIDTGVTNTLLTIRAEHGLPKMECELFPVVENDKKIQFISAVQCRDASAGAK